MLQCRFDFICCEKEGNKEIENEDAYLTPNKNEIGENPILKFAISDGATESSFSKEWADLLVACFKENSFEESSLSRTLELIRNSWQDRIGKVELPWYAQQKVQAGAYAAFLGLTINLDNNEWKSIAIGDSNLFIIRNNNQLIQSFPINEVSDFGNTPYLLSSLSTQNLEIGSHLRKDGGEIQRGDLFILGTDAISAWLLSESKNQGWLNLKNLVQKEGYTETDFKNWIKNKRANKEIKNDDTTLIVIEFS